MSMQIVDFESNGQRYRGAVARKGTTTWYSVNGEVWTVEEGSRAKRGHKGGGAVDPSQIAAPMPGKIIKVVVPVGTDVRAGDVLIVMEAMKMEYTLKAQADGRVREIACQVGEQVVLGAVLVGLDLEGAK